MYSCLLRVGSRLRLVVGCCVLFRVCLFVVRCVLRVVCGLPFVGVCVWRVVCACLLVLFVLVCSCLLLLVVACCCVLLIDACLLLFALVCWLLCVV